MPAAGDCERTRAPDAVQLSVADVSGNTFGIATKHPETTFDDVPAEQVTDGAVVSSTWIVKLQANPVAVVQVTVVVPT